MSQQLILTIQTGPQSGQMFQLSDGSFTVGRAVNNAVQLTDATISKQHARLTIQANSIFVEDLGSSNGTFVNGQRITGPVAFAPGDILQIGTSLILEVQGGAGAAVPIPAAITASAGPMATPPAKGSPGLVMAVVIVVVLIGLGAGAWFVLQSSQFVAETPQSQPVEPTATPLSTDTPSATLMPAVVMDLNVDQTTVQLGQCATLRWQVENAKEVRLDGEEVVDAGSHKVCPQEASKTYRLTALSLAGETSEETVTLTVPPPGVDIEFTTDDSSVTFGKCTMLRWSVENATEVRRETKKVGLTGSEEVCPTEAAVTYNLLVQTLDGENVEQTVTIIVPPTPIPTDTPQPATATPHPQPKAQNPVIDKFIADQNSLNQGSCTTLRWQVRNAQTVRLDGTQVANTGNQRVCPTASNNTYNLVASGLGSGSTQSSLNISVAAVPTATPVIIIVQPTPVYVQPTAGPPSIQACHVVLGGACYIYRWDITGVKEIYFDGKGVAGQNGDSGKLCGSDYNLGKKGQLHVVYYDGRKEQVQYYPPTSNRCH